MKTSWALLLLFIELNIIHAAPFQNLDFDMVNTNTSILQMSPTGIVYTLGVGPSEDLVPGWEIYHYGVRVTTIGYNSGFGLVADGNPTVVGIFKHGFDSPINLSDFPGPGKYAIALCNLAEVRIVYTMVQYGDVPANAVGYSITGLVPRDAEVRMNDVLIGSKTGDVSAFAGQNVKLTVIFPNSPAAFVCPFIDSFQFITAPRVEALSLAATTNSFTMTWTNDAFFSYQVEYTTNFFPAKWQPLGAPVSSTNGNFTFTDNASKTNKFGSQRFYRLRTISP